MFQQYFALTSGDMGCMPGNHLRLSPLGTELVGEPLKWRLAWPFAPAPAGALPRGALSKGDLWKSAGLLR